MRKLAIGALPTVVLLTMIGLRVANLQSSRDETLRVAEARAANLAEIASEYLGETFNAADATLRQLVLHGRRIGGPEAPARDWAPSLASARAGLASIGAITVIDRNMVIRHSTRPEIVGESRAGDPVFKRALSVPGEELVVGTPFRTAVNPAAPIIPLGRRIPDADGSPDGAVVASFLTTAPAGFLRTVDVGTRGTIWIFHSDGLVLFHEPSVRNEAGDSAEENPIFTAAKRGRPRGILRTPLVERGPVMLTAYHTASVAPFIVAASLDREEVLAAWRGEVVGSAVTFAMVAVMMAAALAIVFRQMDQKIRAQQELDRAQRLEEEHLREANERLAAALEREQAARREAEDASALKDQFLMTVSHELRTPLTAIHGWARMLTEGAVEERRRDAALRSIERNAYAQTRLIDDLLDVSRAMSGKLRLDMRAVDVAGVIRAAVETVRPAAQARGVAIESAADPGLGRIAGDPDRLLQIAWNLLSNAVKFTPEGGRVSVSVARAGADIELTVADTGIGIAPDFLPHVFDRFRQQDAGSTRRFGGLGLGLAIVRNLVELHGGSIAAYSDGTDRGARFVVRLPAVPAPEMVRADALALKSSADGQRRLEGVRILVADDDPESRELFAAVLEVAGATVTCVASAGEAMQALADGPHDVLLSDIEMPGVDGYALVRRALARARHLGEKLATVAVTAYSRPEDEARSFAAGFHCHLRKPVDPATLVAEIRAALDQDAGSEPAQQAGGF